MEKYQSLISNQIILRDIYLQQQKEKKDIERILTSQYRSKANIGLKKVKELLLTTGIKEQTIKYNGDGFMYLDQIL